MYILGVRNYVYYTVMSDCLHYVFDALQREICRLIPIEMRPILLKRGVIPPSLDRLCNKTNWIKVVVGYLQDKDFDTFLKFVECICIARNATARPDKQILDSILSVVQDFDARNSTQHSVQVDEIMKQFQKKATLLLGE